MISVRVMRTFFGLGLLVFFPLSVQANKLVEKKVEDATKHWDECATKVHFWDLFAKCIKTRNLNVENVGCFSAVDTVSLCSDSLQADRACLNHLSVNGATRYSSVDALSGCFDTLNANNLCVSNITIGNSLINCVKYSATSVVSTDYTYTFGSDINFDLIVEDPDNDLTTGPTTYTVPLTGYYFVSLQVASTNLQTSGAILGTPIAVLSIHVNGLERRETYSPFLAFSSTQKSELGSLMRFSAGDVVSLQFDVQVVDPVLGLITLTGTTDILGDGTENGSTFSIMYLGSTCHTNPCTPCVPTPPTPCTINCPTCVPCASCPCN